MSSSEISATYFYRNGIIYVRTLPNSQTETVYKIGSTDCKLASRYDNSNAIELYKFKKYDRVYIIHHSSKLTCKQIDNKLKQDINRGFLRTAEHITNSGGNEIYCYSGKRGSDIFNELEQWFKQNRYSFIIAPSEIDKYDHLGHLKMPKNIKFDKYMMWLESRVNLQSSDLPKYLSTLSFQKQLAVDQEAFLRAHELKLQMDEIESLCIHNPDIEENEVDESKERKKKKKSKKEKKSKRKKSKKKKRKREVYDDDDDDEKEPDVKKPKLSKNKRTLASEIGQNTSFILITKGNYDDELTITDDGASMVWYGQKQRTFHDQTVVVGTHVFYRDVKSTPCTYQGTVSMRKVIKERTKTSPIKLKLTLNVNVGNVGRLCDDIIDSDRYKYQDACWRSLQLPKFKACGQGIYKV